MVKIDAAPLVEAVRNGLVEAQHRGFVTICDAAGTRLAQVGDASFATFLRSSAKPLQALVALESGAADAFGFSAEEISRVCGSFSTQSYHLAAVESLMRKVGLHEEQMIVPPSHGCAGKHVAMLATARHQGYPLSGYELPDHPVQRDIRNVIAALARVPAEELGVAVDGCGVPTWWLPMTGIATSFACLVDPPDSLPAALRQACLRVTDAMLAHPDQVGGPGEISTDLNKALHPMLVGKTGAEGLFVMAIRPGYFPGTSRGVGIAIKIEGTASRAEFLTVVETLRQGGLVRPEHMEPLRSYWDTPLYNGERTIVGELRPCFTLRGEEAGRP